MKVLYLSPLVPDVSGNGGKRAIYNHLEDLQRCGALVKAVMVDVEGTGEQCPECFRDFSPVVFPRTLPRFEKGVFAKLSAAAQLLFGRLPRSAAVITSKQIRDTLHRLISGDNFDLVIVDHLNAYAFLDGIPLSPPFLYIAHNIESDVLRDRYQLENRWSVNWIIARIEHWKMLRFERRLIERASKIILISSGDRKAPILASAQAKVKVWPELPSLKRAMWDYTNTKSMLFVGSAKYFPNKEAILWMINKLMPEIRRVDPTITLSLVGTSKQDIGLVDDIPGIKFAGFVSDEKLHAMHLACDLFICPIVLGSGIKIKVLEACSYGMPIIATDESLRGMEFLNEVARILSRDPCADARSVVSLIGSPDKLLEMRDKILKAQLLARSKRPFLLDA
jgi:glycosyltransferase involved in cell wall biosynthesis